MSSTKRHTFSFVRRFVELVGADDHIRPKKYRIVWADAAIGPYTSVYIHGSINPNFSSSFKL